MARASKLVSDLTKIPNIVGGLGLSIAAAQKAFNLDYIESVERLVAVAKSLGSVQGANDPGDPTDPNMVYNLIFDIVKAMAPSRYQFTETTLTVKMDLAQTMDVGATASLGVEMGGVAVNAALTMGYGYDYRAAAEVKTVLHAYPTDAQVMSTLLTQAASIKPSALTLPTQHEVDQSFIDKSAAIVEKVTGVKPPEIETPSPPEDE